MGNTVILKCLDEAAAFGVRRVCAAIGCFDGVHRGHGKLLQELLHLAEETSSVPCVMTFHPHPRCVIAGENGPALLVSEPEKFRLLKEAGAEFTVVIPFTAEFAALTPEEFMRSCLSPEKVRLCGLCVGSAFRFGSGASGDTVLLRQFAERSGFPFRSVKEYAQETGEIVSSTLIRKAVTEGRLEDAAAMLGRKFSLAGTVVHGQGIASKILKFPTANLETGKTVLPPLGVYACRVESPEVPPGATGVMTLGYAPTVRGNDSVPEIRTEVFIHGFSGDLYGKTIRVIPERFLRGERKFPSLDALKQQIALDSAEAFRILHGE